MGVIFKIYPDEDGFNVEQVKQSVIIDSIVMALNECKDGEVVKITLGIVKDDEI